MSRSLSYISTAAAATAAVLLTIGVVLEAQDAARVPIDNAYVRVARSVEEVGHKSRPHGHASSKVSVFLDAGQQSLLTTADNRTAVRMVQAGDAIFDPPVVEHVSLNTASTRLRVIQVDLKQPAAGTPVTFGTDDPVSVAPQFSRSSPTTRRCAYCA